MIDTHCHLTFPDYEGAIDRTLAHAGEHGVTGAITISTTTRDCLEALAIAERYDNVWCSSGVHPLYSDKEPHDWETILRVASSPRCVAWGELGLDNHYDRPPKDVQMRVLEHQLSMIEDALPEIDLPIEVHCRKAFDELIPVFRRTALDPARFVFHCFTGTPDNMRLLLDFGAWVSFTGVLTYKNAPEVREAAGLVPLDRVMFETDAPFLSPEPYRSVRPNEPRYSIETAKFFAKLRGLDWDECLAQINANTERFFGIRVPAAAAG